MRRSFNSALIAFSFLVAGGAAAQAGLSPLGAGIGLKPRSSAPLPMPEPLAGAEAAHIWQSSRRSDFTLYGGARETPRLGLRAVESYSGIVYSHGRSWGSSIEAGYAPASRMAITPRRYSLTGRLHTSFGDGRGISVGLKYQLFDGDAAILPAAGADARPTFVYSLAPSLLGGAGPGPSYQVQFSYQHGAASTFGLAFGRDVETFMPAPDPALNGQRHLTFTGQHWLSPSWALSYDVLSSEPTSPLRVQSLGLRLGVRYRF